MNGMNNNYNCLLTEKQVQELSSTYWKKQMDIEQNIVNKSTDMQFLKEKDQLKLNSMYAMLETKELHARSAMQSIWLGLQTGGSAEKRHFICGSS